MLSNSYGSVWKGRLFSQMTSFPRNDDIHLLFCFYVASFLQSGTVDNFAWIWLFRRVSAEQLKFLQSFTYWLSWVIVGWWNLFGSVSMAVCFDICPNNVVQLSNRNWYSVWHNFIPPSKELCSKMALVEVGMSLPWWCHALVHPAPGYWRLFLNLIIFS